MAKSTEDFKIKIGDDKPKVSLRRSGLADDKTIDQAVDQVATTGTPKVRKSTTVESGSAKPNAAKKALVDELELERMLKNKRLTIDIPFYLHDALREYNFRNRSTTKEVINDYLHGLLKVKNIRVKK